MELQKQLYEIGEYLGAGLYEEPERGPFYRRALALRRFYEKAPLPKYRGGRLYPSGTYDCPLAIKPCSIGGFGIDKAKLDALLPGACDKIREEFGILKSTVPAPHTVAGNMYTHSMPHYKRIAAEGLDSYIPRIEKIADAELREGLLHVVEGIREYLRRIRDYLIASGADEKLIEALSQVPMKPARNIYEALVCHNFVFYLDLCDNEGCLASDLMPYYKGEDITELLREFYKNVNDTGAYSMSLGVDYSPLTVQCLNAARGMRRPMIELFINESCPDEVSKRWQWTGLLMDGQELMEHLSAGYVRFLVGGVLSAVPKGTQPNQVWNYEPYWEHDKLFTSDYEFQTPLTQMELICYDGYAWLIVCDSEFSEKIHQTLPQAKTPKEFYRDK